MPSVPAAISSVLLAFVIAFQIALACGAPWGDLAMGGRFPGKFPPNMRIAAVLRAIVLALLSSIVLIKDGFWLPQLYQLSIFAIWGLVAIFALSLIMNLATPSKWERIIWAPVAALILVSSIIGAVS